MKKCKICKKDFVKKNPLQFVCSHTCAYEYSKLHLKKTELKKSKEIKRENKTKLLEIQPLSFWQNKLQTEINKIAKLIDKDLLCLATQRNTGTIHAGHVFSRGSTPQLRYNLHNIHRQSGQSNHFQSDDLKLREGLISEYGQRYFEYLESSRNMTLNLDKNELKECINKAKIFQKKIEFSKNTSYLDRISLRNEGNLFIFEGKYPPYQ